MKTNQDYYKELDIALQSYEFHKPYHTMKIDRVADKIVWCWKWKKITKEQMEELSDRATKVFEEGVINE